jgi:hypothetical protein
MHQVARQLTQPDQTVLRAGHVLVFDRDSKWSADVPRVLQGAGVGVVVTPIRALNANTYAERFVRSIKSECLDRLRERYRFEPRSPELNHRADVNFLSSGARVSHPFAVC